MDFLCSSLHFPDFLIFFTPQNPLWDSPGVPWVHFLGSNHSQIHMRANFGRGLTVVSKGGGGRTDIHKDR